MKIAITGHRPKVLGWGYDYLNKPHYTELGEDLRNIIINRIENNGGETIEIISGMALGVDTLFALLGLTLKEEGYNVKLHCAIPFKGQENRWAKGERQLYNYILSKADKITYVCEEGYANWKMQKRNEFMVDNCDLLIAVWNGSKSGTANCVNYAKRKGKEIIYINPLEIKG